MKEKKIIFLLIIYITVLVLSPKRYLWYLPSIPPLYPNNENDANIVLNLSNDRNMNDIEFFNKTDESISHAFVEHVDETLGELDLIIQKIVPVIIFFKYTINRARPYQINKNIIKLNSNTDKTHSYPAGHACQAYYLSKFLSKKYPQKKELFENIAKKCDLVRVKAGIHYKTDGIFSKKIVDYLI